MDEALYIYLHFITFLVLFVYFFIFIYIVYCKVENVAVYSMYKQHDSFVNWQMSSQFPHMACCYGNGTYTTCGSPV